MCRTAETTVRVGGQEYRLRPPIHKVHADREAAVDGHFVVEGECTHYGDDPCEQPCFALLDDCWMGCDGCFFYEPDPETVRTWDIECVTALLDAEGMVAGFVCPGCGLPTLLADIVLSPEGYAWCTTYDCDVAVACWQVMVAAWKRPSS